MERSRKTRMVELGQTFTPCHNRINYSINKSIKREFLFLGDSSIPFLPHVLVECSNKILPRSFFSLCKRVPSKDMGKKSGMLIKR